MAHYGLIGYPLGHSFSKKYFADKFKQENITDAAYNNYPIDDIGKLKDIIDSDKELIGLNVTIPYKQQVMPMLDHINEIAKEVGAVNTIRINRKNNTYNLEGFNTDVYGFLHSLKPHLTDRHKKALILGTGGASRAVAYVFQQLHIDFKYVSRHPKGNAIGYQDIDSETMQKHTIIVNTTPLGTYPEVNTCPDIPFEHLTAHHLLYDLVYNPEETMFLRKGRMKNAVGINGLQMLQLQAEKSWEIWNEK
ncbi:MAG: shikimate dehydrogenase family protein [Bacteroidota bacterium]